MATTGERLRHTIDRAAPRLTAVTDAVASQSRGPGKWTRKQLLGHLIDSASNNHQRFIRGQLGDDLVFPTYDQERWVVLGQYANAPWVSLLTLWRELNQQIVRVMDGAPPEVLDALRERTVSDRHSGVQRGEDAGRRRARSERAAS